MGLNRSIGGGGDELKIEPKKVLPYALIVIGIILAILILAGIIGTAGVASPLIILPILLITSGLAML